MTILRWLLSWKETLAIKYRNPELYKHLTGPFRDEDFIEVGPPVAGKTGTCPECGTDKIWQKYSDEDECENGHRWLTRDEDAAL